MRAHLAAFRPRFRPNRQVVWPADHHGRPTMWWRPTGPTASQKTHGKVWLVTNGGLACFPGKRLVAPTYKYKGRGENEDTPHTKHHTIHSSLEFSLG